jgi:hypothetical protein
MSVSIQLRRDTAANWTSVNPILLSGEIGVETDTEKAKLGDGVTAWNSLSYWTGGSSGGAVSSVFGRTGAVTAQTGDYTPAQVGAVSESLMTSQGDLIAGGTSGVAQRLAGDTSNTRKFLREQSISGAAQLPAWDTLQLADIPAQPWQFSPEAFGGKGDGRVATDGAMTATSTTLALTVSTPFTSTAVDGGKAVIVMGAGISGAPLLTTISTVTDSGHAVLAAAASTTVSGKGVIFGTDNTAAIKSAINAAFNYAQANDLYGEIVFQPLMYVVAGAATVGGGTLGNAIFPIPLVNATTNPKVTLSYRGLMSDSSALLHWLQPNIQCNGAVLAVLRLDGANSGTYGPPSVIGGPFQGYGGSTSVFNNLQPVIDNLSVLLPFNSTFSGFDFFGSAEACVKTASVMPMATVASGTPWPQILTGNITNSPQFGLRMPDVNNNDRCDVTSFSSEGQSYGIMVSEHSNVISVRSILCVIGIQAYASSSTPHGAHLHYASVEACSQAMGVLSTGSVVKIQVDQLDYEGPTTFLLYDTANLSAGEIRFRNAGTGYLSSLTNTASGSIRLYNLDQPAGPVGSPQSPPANNAAWVNYYWRDAWVTLSATTVTALKIDATAQGISGSPATYSFLLPSGHSYTPTFTGSLTHTVSLV